MSNPLEKPLIQIYRTIVRLKPEIIREMGVAALEFVDDNFAKSGFQGATFERWPLRKKKDKGKTRKLLVSTSTLRRSFKQTDHANHTTISTDVPYAQIHNEGGTINYPSRAIVMKYKGTKGGKLRLASSKHKVKETRSATIPAHTVTIPARPFLKDSPVLQRRCEKAVLQILIAKL